MLQYIKFWLVQLLDHYRKLLLEQDEEIDEPAVPAVPDEPVGAYRDPEIGLLHAKLREQMLINHGLWIELKRSRQAHERSKHEFDRYKATHPAKTHGWWYLIAAVTGFGLMSVLFTLDCSAPEPTHPTDRHRPSTMTLSPLLPASLLDGGLARDDE